MNETLRDRIIRKLDTLPDEKLYQVLDYAEFLTSRYAERTAQSPNVFQRFAEGVEDSLRAGRVSATTIAETMGLLNKAMGVLNGVAAAGKSVATDVVSVARSAAPTRPTPSPGTPSPGTPANGQANGAGSTDATAPGEPPSGSTA